MSSIAWRTAVTHAQQNEVIYRDYARQSNLFYVSLLDEYQRRFQIFMRSCGFGLVNRMRRNQLYFDRICEEIETLAYHTKRPRWLPEPKPRRQDAQNSYSRDHKRQRPNNDKTTPNTTSNSITNPNVDKDMILPEFVKFYDVFSREMRNKCGTKAPKHANGTIRCNNFHHRGWCYPTCRFSSSHQIKLSDDEVKEGRNYAQQLLLHYNASKQNTPPSIPHGKPPISADTVKSSPKAPGT